MKINYLEFPSKDSDITKKFFTGVLNWQFTDYGDECIAFSDGNIDGGFYKADLCSVYDKGSAIIVFYSKNLEELQERVKTAQGKIVKPIFGFPGAWRFHFSDPNGSEYAIRSNL